MTPRVSRDHCRILGVMPNPQFVTLNPHEVTSIEVEGASVVKVTTCGVKTEAPVYFTTDGAEPAVGGGHCVVLIEGRPVYETARITPRPRATVKLVSAAAAQVRVEAAFSH